MLRALAAVSCSLLFSGCFDFFGIDPEVDAGVVDAGPPIVVPTNPLLGTGTLDTARAASGQFAWDAGGQLTATAADGTVFTLTVPALALVNQEPLTITMTPYSQVDPGLGAESHVAVKLEPEGLQTTTQMMELTITPPAGATWPIAEQVPFSFTGANNVVNLALMRPTNEVKLVLPHFSSYGLALAKKGFSASVEATRHRLGGDVEAQLELETGIRLGQERQKALLGADTTPVGPLFDDFIRRYVAQVLKLRFEARTSSCAAAKLYTQTFLGLSRTLALLGGGETLENYGFNESLSSIFDGEEVCMREEYELCRDNHIITRILPAYLGVARTHALLGDPQVGSLGFFDSKLTTWVKKCLKFTLEVNSTVTLSYGTGNDAWRVTESMQTTNFPAEFVLATDPIDNPPNTAASALGAIVAGTSFEPFTTSNYTQYYANSCDRVSMAQTGGGTGSIAALAFSTQEGATMVERARVRDFSVAVAISPNTSQYVLTKLQRETTGCGAQTSQTTEQYNWTTGWSTWLTSLNVRADDAYITGWSVRDGDSVLATKRVDWTDPRPSYETAHFVSDFTLRHTPDLQ